MHTWAPELGLHLCTTPPSFLHGVLGIELRSSCISNKPLPTGPLPQPLCAFLCGEGTSLSIQSCHRTRQKQYVHRHSGAFSVVHQALLRGAELEPASYRLGVCPVHSGVLNPRPATRKRSSPSCPCFPCRGRSDRSLCLLPMSL